MTTQRVIEAPQARLLTEGEVWEALLAFLAARYRDPHHRPVMDEIIAEADRRAAEADRHVADGQTSECPRR